MLIAERLKLANFNNHRDLEIEFRKGLIGIVGPNGSGKTTILNSMYASITGDFSRFPGVRADCTRIGSGGWPAFVESTWDVDGVKLEYRRSVREGDRPGNSLKVNGGKAITHADRIREETERVLGVTADQLDGFIFKTHRATTAVVHQSPADRFKLFQTLFGLSHYEKIYKFLGDTASAMNAVEVVDNGADIEADLAASAAEIERLADERETLASRAAVLASGRKAAESTLARAAERKKLKDEILELETALAGLPDATAAETASHGAGIDLANWIKSNEGLLAANRRTRDRGPEVLAYESAAAAKSRAQAALKAAEKTLAALSPPAGENPAGQLSDGDASLAVLSSEIAELDRRLAKLEGIGRTCPTCGQSCESIAEIVSDLRKDRAAKQKSYAVVRREQAERQLAAGAWRQYEADRQKAEVSLSSAKHAVKSARVPADPGISFDDVHLASEAITHAEKRTEALRRASEAARGEWDRIREQSRDKTVALQQARTRRAAIAPADREAREAAQKAIADAKAVEARTVEVDAQKRQLELSVARQRRDLEMLRQRLAKAAAANRVKDVVTAARSLFHHRAVPAKLAGAGVGRVCSLVNAKLAEFDSPFRVTLDESFDFSARKEGVAGAHSASRLSDGQAALLSLAFWLAVPRVWNGDINFLALDEPTANLDEANRTFLVESLSKVASKIAGKSQIFMVSHADNLRHCYTQVVELGGS